METIIVYTNVEKKQISGPIVVSLAALIIDAVMLLLEIETNWCRLDKMFYGVLNYLAFNHKYEVTDLELVLIINMPTDEMKNAMICMAQP